MIIHAAPRQGPSPGSRDLPGFVCSTVHDDTTWIKAWVVEKSAWKSCGCINTSEAIESSEAMEWFFYVFLGM